MNIVAHAADYASYSHPKLLAALCTLLNAHCWCCMHLNDRCLEAFEKLTFIIYRPILRIYQSLLGTWSWKKQWLHITKFHTI